MNEEERAPNEAALLDMLRTRVSRAQALRAAVAGMAAAAVPAVASAAASPGTATPGTSPLTTPSGTLQFQFFPQVGPGHTYQTEQITDILAVAVTLEHLEVTLLTNALSGSNALTGLNPLLTGVLQAGLVEELDHTAFLEGFGAKALTDSFSVPNAATFTTPQTFLTTLEQADTIAVAAYMTAVREFAELAQPTLAKLAYQIGAVEAEHRVLSRAALALLYGVTADVPPNNKSFETDMFLYERDVATLVRDLGFLGSGAVALTYPGISAGLTAAGATAGAVIQRRPNNASTSVTATTANLTGEILAGAVGVGPAGTGGGGAGVNGAPKGS